MEIIVVTVGFSRWGGAEIRALVFRCAQLSQVVGLVNHYPFRDFIVRRPIMPKEQWTSRAHMYPVFVCYVRLDVAYQPIAKFASRTE